MIWVRLRILHEEWIQLIVENLNMRRKRNCLEKKSRRRRSSKSVIGIILSICLIPLWIVIFVTLFAAIVTILCAGVGSFAGGVICIWHGCTLFTSAWAQGLFRIGIGIIVLGIVCIIAPILLKLVHIIGKIFISFIRWLFGGRRRYA